MIDDPPGEPERGQGGGGVQRGKTKKFGDIVRTAPEMADHRTVQAVVYGHNKHAQSKKRDGKSDPDGRTGPEGHGFRPTPTRIGRKSARTKGQTHGTEAGRARGR